MYSVVLLAALMGSCPDGKCKAPAPVCVQDSCCETSACCSRVRRHHWGCLKRWVARKVIRRRVCSRRCGC